MDKRQLTELQRLLETDRKREAKALYGRLSRECRYDDDAWFSLGLVLAQSGALDDAASCFHRVLDLAPQDAQACFNLGRIHAMKAQWDKAMAFYQSAIQLNPRFPEAYNYMGIILKTQGHLDGARHAFHKALEFNPAYPEACNNLGAVYYERGETEKAREMYQKALQLNPDFDLAHWNLASAMLLEGNLKLCWDSYERRLSALQMKTHQLPYPSWDGSPLDGKTLLVCAEQGVGDEIMFASCLHDLAAPDARILLECDARLLSLFARAFPGITVIEKQQDTEQFLKTLSRHAPVDVAIQAGSLIRFLRHDWSLFPGRAAYLKPDPERLAAWQARLAALGQELTVGISWRGGREESTRRKRSTTLEQWHDVLATPGVAFVNLQYGECAREIAAVAGKSGAIIHDWPDADPLANLDDFAAQIAALDLVISVDNATVHMAGALGRPVWTLLPKIPDWRWMLEREDSPWYPAMRLFRQREAGQWETVFEEVSRALRQTLI